MKHHFMPIIGDWYQDEALNAAFEVVAIDDEGYVGVQYFSGEIEGFDQESWFELELNLSAPPKDATGPYELVREDINAHDEVYPSPHWVGPLDDILFD